MRSTLHNLRRYRPAFANLASSPLASVALVAFVAACTCATIYGIYAILYSLVESGVITCSGGRDPGTVCSIRHTAFGYTMSVISIIMLGSLIAFAVFVCVRISQDEMSRGKTMIETPCGQFLVITLIVLLTIIVFAFAGWIHVKIGVVDMQNTSNYSAQVAFGSVLFFCELLFVSLTAVILWYCLGALRDTYRSFREDINTIRGSND